MVFKAKKKAVRPIDPVLAMWQNILEEHEKALVQTEKAYLTAKDYSIEMIDLAKSKIDCLK